MRVEELIVTNEMMPAQPYEGLWDSIVAPDWVKGRLLRHTLLGLRLRPDLPFTTTALHGLVLLYGPPGNGKTTLARSLPQELAPFMVGRKARLIEVNPHGLMSAEHGRSQQLVLELLDEHVPALADDGVPTVVVIDEVEAIAVARSQASLQANPVDVHRATDAVLAALDRNAVRMPHVLTVATSNFTGAIDEAFLSRADAAIEVPLPNATAITTILRKTLGGFAAKFPALRNVADDTRIEQMAARLVGADARRIRKLVTEAMASRIETARDPGALTVEDLLAAGHQLARALCGGDRAAA